MNDKPEIGMLETDAYLAEKEQDYLEQISFFEKQFMRAVLDGIENLAGVFKYHVLLLKEELSKIQKKRAELSKY